MRNPYLQRFQELSGTLLMFLGTHAKLFISNQGGLAIACYVLHATSGGGITPHFVKGKIVDTILRINRTLLKTGKHAFFFKKK